MFIRKTPIRLTIKGYVKDDCTINAIGNALGISYDLARKILQVGVYYNGEFVFARRNPRKKQDFTNLFHVKRISRALSVGEIEFYGENKSLIDVSRELNEGTYIVLVKGHLTTLIDGKIIDTWNSGDSIVSVAYKVDQRIAKKTVESLANYYRLDSKEHMYAV